MHLALISSTGFPRKSPLLLLPPPLNKLPDIQMPLLLREKHPFRPILPYHDIQLLRIREDQVEVALSGEVTIQIPWQTYKSDDRRK